jgi:hypothetical protein
MIIFSQLNLCAIFETIIFTLSDLLKIISLFSTLLLVIFYLIFRKRNNDKKFRVILLYAILSFIFDFLTHIFLQKRFYLNSSFTLIEYTFFSYFLYLSYKEKLFKWLLISCLIIFFLIFFYSIIHNNDVQFDYLPSSIAGVLIIIFCILFFYEQLNNPEIIFVYASKTFWIVLAFLLYMSTTLILFVSIGGLKLSIEQKNSVWQLNIVANIIKNILFGIAFYKLLIMSIDSSSGKTGKMKLYN